MFEHCRSFRLFVLCMDTICYDALLKMDLPYVSLISLQDFEKDDEALRIAKANRTIVEYYFTCTPSLPLYIFNHFNDINSLTYLDSDFFFFSSPEPAMKIIEKYPIAITSHRFPPVLRKLEKKYGVFNVGWLTFQRNEQAISCLQRWREQCLEWCYDRLEEGRFADQMYLNEWPELYPDTLVIPHKGVSLAPYNIANDHVIIKDDNNIMIAGDQLICYHFCGLKDFRGFLYYLSLRRYGMQPTCTILEQIYEPYLQILAKCKQQANKVLNEAIKNTSLRERTQVTQKYQGALWINKIISKYDRYMSLVDAILSRNFVLFFDDHIIFKFISCGLDK